MLVQCTVAISWYNDIFMDVVLVASWSGRLYLPKMVMQMTSIPPPLFEMWLCHSPEDGVYFSTPLNPGGLCVTALLIEYGWSDSLPVLGVALNSPHSFSFLSLGMFPLGTNSHAPKPKSNERPCVSALVVCQLGTWSQEPTSCQQRKCPL